MLDRLDSIIVNWKADYDYRTFLSAGFSLAVSLVFTAYNGFLGIWHQSLWNGSICLYYLVLSIIRGAIIVIQGKAHRESDIRTEPTVRLAFRITSLALIAMNLTLIIPVSLMVMLEKPTNIGLVPAIVVAAYTTYRLTMACINYRKRTKSENLLTKELRSINLMDALLAIISLQNALVSAKGASPDGSILSLMAVSGAFLLIGIIVVSVRNYAAGMREIKAAPGHNKAAQ